MKIILSLSALVSFFTLLGCTSVSLLTAISTNDIPKVRELISQGADVNGSSALRLPLNRASADGRTEIVRLLLANGANVNARSGSVGPLISASRNCQLDVMKILLASGAIPNDTFEEQTALFQLYYRARDPTWTWIPGGTTPCSTDTIDLLIQNGVDRNAKDGSGNFAWMVALYATSFLPYGKVHATYMLSKGANIPFNGPILILPFGLYLDNTFFGNRDAYSESIEKRVVRLPLGRGSVTGFADMRGYSGIFRVQVPNAEDGDIYVVNPTYNIGKRTWNLQVEQVWRK